MLRRQVSWHVSDRLYVRRGLLNQLVRQIRQCARRSQFISDERHVPVVRVLACQPGGDKLPRAVVSMQSRFSPGLAVTLIDHNVY